MKDKIKNKKLKKSPIFIIILFNFLVIILIAIYIIYLRFIPYKTITYDGYAVSGKELASNLLNKTFDVDQTIEAIEVKDQDEIYKNLRSYYIGPAKEKSINIDYPIYANNNLALYNLSEEASLITTDLKQEEGYSGLMLTSGALYNANTLERADYNNYILMKNSDNLYINTQEIKIRTNFNKYTIGINSIINFADGYITYYTLEDRKFNYGKILDVDLNSSIEIEYFKRTYTYKEFLLGLNIIKEQNPNEEDIPKEENKVEEAKKDKEEKTTENKVKKEKGTKDEELPQKWQKPNVSCGNFKTNPYTSEVDANISDPSAAIVKSVVFTFYKKDKISFRLPITATGKLNVTKLTPNTKYNVIGTYQYKDETGRTIEVKFTEQEIKTKGTNEIKSIDLSFENGEKYINKIELLNLGIVSNIKDEAIYGVEKATIKLNDVEYPIDSNTLRNLLEGKKIDKYELTKGVLSNKKYNYEIIFYDTASNKMKLINNTGNTFTLKAKPTVDIRLKKQNVISVDLSLELKNDDGIKISNYRYILYGIDGKQIQKENLQLKTNILTFKDLDSEKSYNIKVYADFDMEDGKGKQENVQIGDAIFNTVSLDRLGALKVNLDYDETKDLTSNSIKFIGKIDTKRTDKRLISILKEVRIDIIDKNKEIVKTYVENELDKLEQDDGKEFLTEGLNSNYEYTINVTAKARQGNEEKNIKTSYTLKNIETKKCTPTVNVYQIVTTDNTVDFALYIDDKDGASLKKDEKGKIIYKYRLKYCKEETSDNEYEIVEEGSVRANSEEFLKFQDTMKNGLYKIDFIAEEYNDTNYNKYKQGFYNITDNQKIEFVPSGLTGMLNLIGVQKEKAEGKNLVDITANNNWYSECFNIKDKNYRNYGKTYKVEENASILKLTANQCYVYDLSGYKGQEVTMSFKAVEGTSKINIQRGKEIKENEDRIKLESIDKDGDTYYYTTKVPEDGYLGFFIDGEDIATINDLKIELGTERTDYEKYNSGIAKSEINYNLRTDRYVELEDGKENRIKYYIKVNDKRDDEDALGLEQIGEIIEGENNSKNYISFSKTYKVLKDGDYKIQLIASIYGREYILDEVNFSYNEYNKSNYKYSEIKYISTAEEFKEIQPDGNYFILNNIDLTKENKESEYTFGNDNIKFNGKIDFDGKTISKDVVLNNGNKNTSYIFYNIGENATISNIVLDFYINNNEDMYKIDKLDGLYGIFLYNKGIINNLRVNLKQCNTNSETPILRRYIGLIGYQNIGTIDRFIINLEVGLYGEQYIAGGCLESSGTIKNGYMYGENIYLQNEINTGTSRNSAGIVYDLKGELKNIYNLTGIEIKHCQYTDSYVANIAYRVNSGATLKNVYSVKDCGSYLMNRYILLDRKGEEVNAGPNIFENNGNVNQSYYFCEYMENERTGPDTYSEKSNLTNFRFQNMLNDGDNLFNVEGQIEKGYYPILNLNRCMPPQKKIKMFGEYQRDTEIDLLEDTVKVHSKDTIDAEIDNIVGRYKNVIRVGQGENEKEALIKHILLGYSNEEKIKDINIDGLKQLLRDEIIEKDNQYLISMEVYNPSGYNIGSIKIQNIRSKVLSQYHSIKSKKTVVFAVVRAPYKYVDNYRIMSIENTYGDVQDVNISKQIKAPCYKSIQDVDDWKEIYMSFPNSETEGESIKDGLEQNYKLKADLDFDGVDLGDLFKDSVFSGKIEGNEYTLKNINNEYPLFKTLTGKIKDLNIENYNSLKAENGSTGVIGENRGTIENTSIKNIKIDIPSREKEIDTVVGGLCGTVSSNKNLIGNSAENVTIIMENQNNVIIGGLYGEITGTGITISESKVKNINVNPDVEINAENFTVGGICGSSKGNNSIEYSSVDGLKINCKDNKGHKIGGILGVVTRNSDALSTQISISKCFTQNIDIKIDNVEVNGIGGILGYGDNKTKDNYINYCWSQGIIRSNRGNIGGIVGYLYNGTVNGCYSLINISSRLNDGANLEVIPQQENIKGIIGYNFASTTIITNNLYLGNIETASIIDGNINRIGGTSSKKTNNYAYKNQIIGKTKIEDIMDSNGLLDTMQEEINTQFGKLDKITENYKIPQNSYETEEYELPKLIKDREEIPNQTKNKLKTNSDITGRDFEIIKLNAVRVKNNGEQVGNDKEYLIDTNVYSEENQNGTRTKITLTYKSNYNYKIKDIKFSLDAMSIIGEIPDATKNSDGTYTIVFYAKPEKYLDNYYINTIIYQNTNNEIINEEAFPKKLIGIKYYKQLSNENDWNTKMTNDEENYLLTSDIELNSIRQETLNCNINRLEGDGVHTIDLKNNISWYEEEKRNIIDKENGEKYIDSNFINTINVNLENVKFTNFAINNGCLIKELKQVVKNCNFNNIKIIYDNNVEEERIGIIGQISSGNSKIVDTNISNITVIAEGYNYVGGLCGYSSAMVTTKNTMNIQNIRITGQHYVGGVLGYGRGLVGNFDINNINIVGKDYIGGLCGINYLSINNGEEKYDINALTVNVSGRSYVGGLLGKNYGQINNVNTKSKITGEEINVKGETFYIGGIIGQQSNSGCYNIQVNNQLSVEGSKRYGVGGIIGSSSGKCENLKVIGEDGDKKKVIINNGDASCTGGIIGSTTGYSKGLELKNGEITCKYNGGGCIGKTTQKSEDLSTENVTIKFSGKESGTNNSNIGGCIGISENDINNLKSKNVNLLHSSYIGTINNVGGCVGSTNGISNNLTAENLTIKGEYDVGSANNVGGCVGSSESIIINANSNKIHIEGRDTIGGIVGKTSYNKSGDPKNNYTIFNSKVNEGIIIGTGNNIGGIVGVLKGTIYKTSTSENKISGNNNVGGIVGSHEGGDKSYEQYYLLQAFCSKSTINGKENVGGLVGNLRFGDISFCYSANNIISGNNVGGLIGYVNNANMNTRINNEIVNIRYTLVVNTLNGTENYFAGSVIGKKEKELDKEVLLNNVIVNKNEKYYTNNDGEVIQIDNVSDLKKEEFYRSIGLLEEDKFKHKENYYPYLAGIFKDDDTDFEKQKIEVQNNGENTTSNRNNSLIAVMALKQNVFEQIELPDVYVYAVDANRVNIEFNKINPNTYFKIEANGKQILANTSIEEKVYTFEYDFSTNFSITISSLKNWYKKDIEANDLKNLLDIQKDEYLYLTENKIYSNKRSIDGEYLNLYKGKALSTDYKIYNLENMNIIKKHKGILTLIKEQVPITSKEYNNNKIETFYHCSKITDEQGNYTYQDKQIFIKNGLMFMLDGSLQSKGNSVIIDSYNNNQYETILGVDNRLYNLLSEIKYPADFKNEKILQMMGNIDNNNNIVLVYYENGRVYGFNYITGEEVFNNNIKEQDIGLITFITNSLNSKKALYNINKDTYNEAQKLTDKLEKTSIQQAVIQLDLENKNNGEITTDEGEKKQNNNDDNNIKYAQMYDTKNNKYVVYSSQDLIKTNLKSEDEKIEQDEELVTFYTNLSTSKTNFKQIGMILFMIVIGTVCVILIFMYRKSHKRR